jgi:hypothetical protein
MQIAELELNRSGLMSGRRIITEFILLIADDWNGRPSDVLKAVMSAGGEVISVDEGNGILKGCIQSMDLPRLERLACVRQLVEGASYVTCRFQAGRDHELGYDPHGGVHEGARSHAPKPHRSADTRPPRLRPSACRARPRLPLSPPVRPAARPGINRPALCPGYSGLSQRLLWKAEDWAPCDRLQHRPAIPLSVRLAYGLVVALGVAIATRTAMDHEYVNCLSMVRLLSGSLTAVLATLAACGLCRYPQVRHACTYLALWLAVSACLLETSFPEIDMALGLAAFLLAGCASDTLGDT